MSFDSLVTAYDSAGDDSFSDQQSTLFENACQMRRAGNLQGFLSTCETALQAPSSDPVVTMRIHEYLTETYMAYAHETPFQTADYFASAQAHLTSLTKLHQTSPQFCTTTQKIEELATFLHSQRMYF